MDPRFSSDRDADLSLFNSTKDESTINFTLCQILQITRERHSNKPAVIYGDSEVNYGILHDLADRVACLLRKKGVKPGDLVGVALERSADLVSVLIGVLNTGAAYVPIDPGLPSERIQYMLEDARPKVVIVTTTTLHSVAAWEGPCLKLEDKWSSEEQGIDSAELGSKPGPNDLAYVIYTSGSTGRPKGVEITHQALSNTLLGIQKVIAFGSEDTLLAVTTISFDISALEIFLPLISGGTVVVADQDESRSATALQTLLRRYKVTTMQATPSAWEMLLDYGWPEDDMHLDKILCGGEALSRRLADRLLHDCRHAVTWNMYGPTEATVWASCWKVQEQGGISIGQPLPNYQLCVLDDNLEPVTNGESGELYIGGLSLARGYHKNPQLTGARFMANPFHGNRMYRTGDIARFSAPGVLSVLGRLDNQVKLRGHRIELGDIESNMMKHPWVSQAVVILRDQRLLAYFKSATRKGSSINVSELELVEDLRTTLAGSLPHYMIPAFFVEVDRFPLSPSGKVDRNALCSPTPESKRPVLTKSSTGLTEKIWQIWRHVLDHDQFGQEDNFFKIGGDSLRVVRVQKELEKLLGKTVSPAVLFRNYTIKALAENFENYEENSKELNKDSKSKNGDVRVSENIAVIGMACRLPGGISTPEQYWQLLVSNGDVIKEVPKGRWKSEPAEVELQTDANKSYCQQGGFLSDIDSFDAPFFSISPREALSMEPSQYIMLETCWEAFERAGYTNEQISGSKTGVFTGISNMAAHQDNSWTYDKLDGYRGTKSASSVISGRVSYALGLEGPTLTVDTACSSSLVATHLACSALQQGECDMALSGGITVMATPALHIEFSKLGGMSADGRCRAFSEDADGTGWGEGAVTLLLKRAKDAERDGDEIHAILEGSAVNHGGRSAGLTIPSPVAQERLIRTALTKATLTPSDIDYVEAHGTATKLGDPIEGAALSAVFSGSRSETGEPLWIGSAKSNIGHTQAAAGLAGLLKVVLALHHKVLPATIHVTRPTPSVDWKGTCMQLTLQNHTWPRSADRRRRAGVSSFGIGGTNAHIIVGESERQTYYKSARSIQKIPRPHIIPFVLSGVSAVALRHQAEKLLQMVKSQSYTDDLADMAYSLATTRTHFRHRTVLLVQNKQDLKERLAAASTQGGQSSHVPDVPPKVAMLFTGQGSQWAGMGKTLAEQYPVFQQTVNQIAPQFDRFLQRPLLEVMWADSDSTSASLLQNTRYSQPALFTLQVALWHLWRSWGVFPEFVLGHSVGELAAAYVADVMELPDACRIVAIRGRLMASIEHQGKMVSIEGSSSEVNPVLREPEYCDRVGIASLNSPNQVVVSGDTDAIDSLLARFSAQGRKTNVLQVSHAFHSHHMEVISEQFLSSLRSVSFSPPKIPVVSGLTGRIARPGFLEEPVYWVEQARRPVRFSDGIETLASHNVNVFLEIGPQPVLCSMGQTCMAVQDKQSSTLWLPSLVKKGDGISVIQGSLAKLHTRRLAIDWEGYFKPFGCHRIQMPTYTFQREQVRSQKGVVRGLNGHAKDFEHPQVRVSGSNGDAGHEAKGYKFSINWYPLQNDTPPASAHWGLIYPISKPEWASDMVQTLLKAGIRTHNVSSISEARDLDGLLFLWHSEAEILSQTRELVKEALSFVHEVSDINFPKPIAWVTRNSMGACRRDVASGLGSSILWGLARTARKEHLDLRLWTIDIGPEAIDYEAIPSSLLPSSENEYVLRAGQALVPRMELENAASRAEIWSTSHFIRTDGAVLVTGGTGGLGQRVCRWLVEAHGIRDLVLLSRRGADFPNAHAFVGELSEFGAHIAIVSCDVADFHALETVMENFDTHRPLRGVIHAAGVLDDGVLSALTLSRCEKTFKPKVDGAWHLHNLTKDLDLDIFVLFSSISGITGNGGQANYAAANTFLDSLAYLRHDQGLPATSVAWGVWSGSGMGNQMDTIGRSQYGRDGLEPLSEKAGLQLLEQAIIEGQPLTVAAAYDLGRLQDYYHRSRQRPPLLLSLLGPEIKGGDGVSNANQEWDLKEKLKRGSPEDHAAIVLRVLQEAVAISLGHGSPLDVNTVLSLQDIGVDSLTAVLTCGELTKLTGITFLPKIIFDYSNLESLSQHVLALLLQGFETPLVDQSTNAHGDAPKRTESQPMRMDLMKRGCLDPTLTFRNAEQLQPATPRAIFVTGATGFVGAFVVHELLKLGLEVHCLVRSEDSHKGLQRLITTLLDYSLWCADFTPLLKCVVGDMSQPLLGLNEETFANIANSTDSICHVGALVDWMRPLETYIGPNVVSTHEILRLASQGRPKTVHMISTASTLPKHSGIDIPESDREFGYATSKWIAEQMVSAARWRGLSASVYRLPFVTASASSGHFRDDQGDFFHNLIVGSIELGCFPSLAVHLSAVLPVDYLARTVTIMMTRDISKIGQDFDFLNPKAPYLDHLFTLFSNAVGGHGLVDFNEWRRRALTYAAAHPTSRLARIAVIVDMLTEESAAAMINDSNVGRHVLGGESYPVPAIEQEFVDRYIACIRASTKGGIAWKRVQVDHNGYH